MKIIGISAFYHDSAACLIVDGSIIAAAQEERFSRIKNDATFPIHSIKFCLDYSSLDLENIDAVIFYDKPLIKFERLIETFLATIPKGFRAFKKFLPVWLKQKLFLKRLIHNELKKVFSDFDINKIYFSEHHFSHAASAFYPSPFEKALVITIDGVGEWATTSVCIGEKNNLEIIKEIYFPHSLGLLYSAFTYYLGFKVNDGEYKVMGLAPYGIPKYKKLILDNLIDLKKDGSFKIIQKYFNYSSGLTMISKDFEILFGKKRRLENDKITNFHMNVAASLQSVTEDIIIKMCKSIKNEYKIDNLCLAGGVALNCVANGKLIKEKIFKNVWIQPASGDAGGSIGAALGAWHYEFKNERAVSTKSDSMKGSLLGPEYSNEEIEDFLCKNKVRYSKINFSKLISLSANLLAKGKIIGWFQGRMEFGPRALGQRSILADPRRKNMQKDLNLKIKYRESFRPFAPIILEDHLHNWFDLDCNSPYMLLVANLREKWKIKNNNYMSKAKSLKLKNSVVPAITHVDFTSRIQTINKNENEKIYKLLNQFYKITNCPILVNTSFNVRDEPIVCSPRDAYKCMMGTKIDYLIMGEFIIKRSDQCL